MTITGTDLLGGTVVDFGSTPATSVVVDSATEITAKSPAGTGTVNITVTGPGGVSSTSTADQFTYGVGPVVTGVSPAAGPTAGGITVTITGTGFTGVTAVDFGTTAATSVVVVSATEVTATSPAGTGTVNVTVTGPSGISPTSIADQFTYRAAPTVAGISPSVGPAAGGTSVTITGTGFTGATAVDFGTIAAKSVVVNSATEITATSPAATAGTVDVTVIGPGGTSPTSSADKFLFLGVTAVSSTQPSGMYGAPTAIPITVTFSEPVTVTGVPQLALNAGYPLAGGGATASYASGSGTSALTFTYTVAAGQSSYDLDYSSTAALNLNSGTIEDASNNAATLTLPATGTDGLAAQNIVIVPIADGFESGSFGDLVSGDPSTAWQLSSSGPSPADWTIESSDVAPGGSYAAQSGAIGASSSSTLSVTLTEPAGEIAFWRSVSSAPGSGLLSFQIDGVSLGQWSGAVSWQQSFYWVSAGTHTYSWVYSEGTAAPQGSDAAWLDNVQFLPGTTLVVEGTAAASDQFTFNGSNAGNASNPSIVVGLNGENHTFAAGAEGDFSKYLFLGNGSGAGALLAGSSAGGDTALLYANGSGQLNNSTAGYAVAVDGMSSIHVSGQESDTAKFFDSPGNDTFYAYADYDNDGPAAGIYGGGFANSASGFGTNLGYSTNGGSDTAYFFDSQGNSTYLCLRRLRNQRQAIIGHVRHLRGLRRVRQRGQRLRHERRQFDRRRQRYRLPLRFAG